VPALRALSADFVIAGTANTTLAGAVLAAAALDHGPPPVASVADLVASPDFELVSVTVRLPHHLDTMKTAITAGKHVYGGPRDHHAQCSVHFPDVGHRTLTAEESPPANH
jgi:predicted dehydrogenase